MSGTPLNTVVTRNDYYRDGYRSLLRIAIAEGIAVVFLIAVVALGVGLYKPHDRFFATTSDGKLVPMVSLDQPYLTTSAVLTWASQAANDVMTFGFHDYRRRLQDSAKYFTKRGWQSFTEALQKARIIESVERYQQVVTATPGGAPIVREEGLVGGVYRWVIEMPLLVTFQSGSKTQNMKMMLTMVVTRVPTLESPSGVGIEQWIADLG